LKHVENRTQLKYQLSRLKLNLNRNTFALRGAKIKRFLLTTKPFRKKILKDFKRRLINHKLNYTHAYLKPNLKEHHRSFHPNGGQR